MDGRNCYRTKIASHRAGTLLWGELTPMGFRNTLKLPVEQVELDIHLSKDGRLVVMHDHNIGRVTDSKGEIAELAWPELSKVTINYSGGQNPLLLEDVCELYSQTDVDLRLEIKTSKDWVHYEGIEENAVDVIRSFGMEERTTISSFSLQPLQNIEKFHFTGNRLWLVGQEILGFLGMGNVYSLGRQIGINAFSVHIGQIKDSIDFFRTMDASIGAYGAHCHRTITEALALEVDVFTTDRPDLAAKLREKTQNRIANST